MPSIKVQLNKFKVSKDYQNESWNYCYCYIGRDEINNEVIAIRRTPSYGRYCDLKNSCKTWMKENLTSDVLYRREYQSIYLMVHHDDIAILQMRYPSISVWK